MGLTLTATTETTVKLAPSVKRKLLTNLRLYQELKAQIAALQAQSDAAKAEVEELRQTVGEDKLELEGYKIAYVQGVRGVLDHKKLIELGCAAAWIAEATENKPNKPFIKITCPGDK